ncbi:sigma-54-dependent transcriptional regulator [Desulfoferrobacter suflitae]|uniref:sigma-54-dependent transcriptional regulator n=1 Tax=Desulfoferrobacter suflitae TaxID=2865782 RepID=UPI00216476DB|nr:sigma-54 dependent transcriptional regulator [Desulfoferrobacter suflitae]MCK8602448.1 sigma-54 dependent transcriptional regulator [Desulfoferrobacter suflitae]
MKLLNKVLLVDDDPLALDLISENLKTQGYSVELACSGIEAVEKAKTQSYDIVITDLSMPGMDGLQLLDHFKINYADTMVIVLTGFGTIGTAVEALKKGAFDYMTKPANMDEILLALNRIQELHALKMDNVMLRSQLQERYQFDNIIGRSAPMEALYRIIRRVAKTDSTVLLTGESGTGKELIANAIHFSSDRNNKPIVPINCGAIPEELLESELFGHEKGAFTGAVKERKGRFELAHRGTIFLDEIGEMPLKLQVKLLRFLQERKFERIGGGRTIQVDVRIIAATNKDLEKAVENGEFREDLYYRINVIPIRVPPLRERDGDVALIAQHFLRQHCMEKGVSLKKLTSSAMAALEAYEWPGNVRELENLIERLVILTEADVIQMNDLPARIRRQPKSHVENKEQLIEAGGVDLKKTLDELENRLIMEALEKANGVRARAAQLLGLNRTTLVEKMKKKHLTY